MLYVHLSWGVVGYKNAAPPERVHLVKIERNRLVYRDVRKRKT
ncbi:MAG TPA: hypothetical protein VGE66_04285 [Chitinophagaceae bacterium]